MLRVWCLALAAVFIFVASGKADIVRVDFTGMIESVDSSITSEFSVGEPLMGMFFVDTNTATTQANIRTFYDGFGLSVTIGDNLVTGSVGSGTVFNDQFDFEFEGSNLSGQTVNGLTPNSFEIFLLFDPNSLNIGAFPTIFPAPSGPFGGNLSNYEFTQEDGPFVGWDIESITVSVVPEPSNLGLLGLVPVLGVIRRRR